MSKVIITMPGLAAHEAKDLVNMALNEWRSRRSDADYVETRYAHTSQASRDARAARLEREFAAFAQINVDTEE